MSKTLVPVAVTVAFSAMGVIGDCFLRRTLEMETRMELTWEERVFAKGFASRLLC